MRKKWLALCLSVVMAAGVLAGCGSTKDADDSTASDDNGTSESASEDVKEDGDSAAESVSGDVHYAFWDVNFQPWIEACIEEFNKIYPDVNVILEPTPWDEYWTKLEAAATGGSLADVFWMNGPNIVKYANGGILLPFDEMLETSELDLANYPSGMIDLYNVGGAQYGIPFTFDTIGVWYNKALFDEAGVEYPTDDWTWEDMVEIAEKLTKEDGSVYGIAAPFATQQGIYSTIFAYGGYVISDDRKTSGYDLPETQAGIQCWIDLLEAGLSPSQASLEETVADAQFLSGSVAMEWEGSWFLSQVKGSDVEDVVDVVELPSINGIKGNVIHGVSNCIFEGTENPKAAWAFAEFMAGETANKLCAEMGICIPTLSGTTQLWADANSQYNLKSFIVSAEEYATAYPVSANTAEWNQYESDNLKKAFALEIDVKTAADNLAKQMNEVLANE